MQEDTRLIDFDKKRIPEKLHFESLNIFSEKAINPDRLQQNIQFLLFAIKHWLYSKLIPWSVLFEYEGVFIIYFIEVAENYEAPLYFPVM